MLFKITIKYTFRVWWTILLFEVFLLKMFSLKIFLQKLPIKYFLVKH